MNSSMIGKIDKARRYAQEPQRAKFEDLHIKFEGGHDTYDVTMKDGTWECTCHTYESLHMGTCSHIMAVEKMLQGMIPNASAPPSPMTANRS